MGCSFTCGVVFFLHQLQGFLQNNQFCELVLIFKLILFGMDNLACPISIIVSLLLFHCSSIRLLEHEVNLHIYLKISDRVHGKVSILPCYLLWHVLVLEFSTHREVYRVCLHLVCTRLCVYQKLHLGLHMFFEWGTYLLL